MIRQQPSFSTNLFSQANSPSINPSNSSSSNVFGAMPAQPAFSFNQSSSQSSSQSNNQPFKMQMNSQSFTLPSSQPFSQPTKQSSTSSNNQSTFQPNFQSNSQTSNQSINQSNNQSSKLTSKQPSTQTSNLVKKAVPSQASIQSLDVSLTLESVLSKHPVLSSIDGPWNQIIKQSNNQSFNLTPRLAVSDDGDCLFVLKKHLYVIDLKSINQSINQANKNKSPIDQSAYQSVRIEPNEQSDNQSINHSIKVHGRYVCLYGDSSVTVVKLPRSINQSMKRSADQSSSQFVLLCPFYQIGEMFYGNQSTSTSFNQSINQLADSSINQSNNPSVQIYSVLFHPLSLHHLAVLSSDAVLRLYRLTQDIDSPEQSIDLNQSNNQSISESVNPPIDFTFGPQVDWSLLSCLVARSNGLIDTVCPFVPFGIGLIDRTIDCLIDQLIDNDRCGCLQHHCDSSRQHSFDQLINQSVGCSIDCSQRMVTYQYLKQAFVKSVDDSFNQSINQPTGQSNNQSIYISQPVPGLIPAIQLNPDCCPISMSTHHSAHHPHLIQLLNLSNNQMPIRLVRSFSNGRIDCLITINPSNNQSNQSLDQSIKPAFVHPAFSPPPASTLIPIDTVVVPISRTSQSNNQSINPTSNQLVVSSNVQSINQSINRTMLMLPVPGRFSDFVVMTNQSIEQSNDQSNQSIFLFSLGYLDAIDQSINEYDQSINQSNNQSRNSRSISQANTQAKNHMLSIIQSSHLSINQIDQSNNQSNQSGNHFYTGIVISQSTKQSISQSNKQSRSLIACSDVSTLIRPIQKPLNTVAKSINESNNQSNNQSINRPNTQSFRSKIAPLIEKYQKNYVRDLIQQASKQSNNQSNNPSSQVEHVLNASQAITRIIDDCHLINQSITESLAKMTHLASINQTINQSINQDVTACLSNHARLVTQFDVQQKTQNELIDQSFKLSRKFSSFNHRPVSIAEEQFIQSINQSNNQRNNQSNDVNRIIGQANQLKAVLINQSNNQSNKQSMILHSQTISQSIKMQDKLKYQTEELAKIVQKIKTLKGQLQK